MNLHLLTVGVDHSLLWFIVLLVCDGREPHPSLIKSLSDM